VISHDILRILDIAHRVVVLRHGRIALERYTKDVTQREVIDAMVGYDEGGDRKPQ